METTGTKRRKRIQSSADPEITVQNKKRKKMGSFLSSFSEHSNTSAILIRPGPTLVQNEQANNNKCRTTQSRITQQRTAHKNAARIADSGSSDESESSSYDFVWEEDQRLAQISGVPRTTCFNFIQLLKSGQTLPFIARYRKNNVGNLKPEILIDLYEDYSTICLLKKKAKTAVETLRKNKKLSPAVEKSILSARTLFELDLVYAPLKTQTLTLAERARKLNLENPAIQLLNDVSINFNSLCKANNPEVATPSKVEEHIIHIIADIIYKDPRVIEQINKLKQTTMFTMQSSKKSISNKKLAENSKTDPETFKLYFEFKKPTKYLESYQVLAINRGEDLGFLSVKIDVPDNFLTNLQRICLQLWSGSTYVKKGLNDAYTRLIRPWLTRIIRSELTNQAHKDAIKAFSSNLEKCLLTEPIKNKRIVGVDPGFRQGCKIGIIDSCGRPLHTCTIYPNFNSTYDQYVAAFNRWMNEYRVDVIALGNGTACRETEKWLKNHLERKLPIIIVPEDGASIYSVTKDALEENNHLDSNLISALSIARRAMDPLGELIKVEPKHLGIGMYQHDVPTKMLESALDLTVEKVVSLVGADLNNASKPLLSRIAGLSASKAAKIIEYRSKNNGFKTRSELKKVPGIGEVTYNQCAGFLKIANGPEVLDNTIIHPESYHIAKDFASKLKLNLRELNSEDFPKMVEMKVSLINLDSISRELRTDIFTTELIVGAFKHIQNADLPSLSKPIYCSDVQNLEQLKKGMTLPGVVRNVVDFGCFVDLGTKEDGLIHKSKFGANPRPNCGDRVMVTVTETPKPKRIQLRLEKIL